MDRVRGGLLGGGLLGGVSWADAVSFAFLVSPPVHLLSFRDSHVSCLNMPDLLIYDPFYPTISSHVCPSKVCATGTDENRGLRSAKY